jgi:hypothetical protein
MEGKREEVLAAKAKAREERDKAKETSTTSNTSNGVRHNQSGRAYIIDSETKQAILLATEKSDDHALAALTTSSVPKRMVDHVLCCGQIRA